MPHEFVVDSRTESTIQVRHLAEGHRYAFQVAEGAKGRRILGRAIIRQGMYAAHKGKFFVDEARLFAEREGRIAGLID